MIILSTSVNGDLPREPMYAVSAGLACYGELASDFVNAAAFYGRLNPDPTQPVTIEDNRAYLNALCEFRIRATVPRDIVLVITDERLAQRKDAPNTAMQWFTRSVYGQDAAELRNRMQKTMATADQEFWEELYAAVVDFLGLCGVEQLDEAAQTIYLTQGPQGETYLGVRVVQAARYDQYESAVRTTVNTMMEQDARTMSGARSQEFLRKNPLSQVVMLCDHGFIDEEGAIWLATNTEAPYRVDVRPRSGATQFTAEERAAWAQLFSYDDFEECPLVGIRALGDHEEIHTFQLDFAQSSLEFEIPALGAKTAQ